MRKRLVSFDNFYQQKNVEYIKLMSEAHLKKSHAATKRRLQSYFKKSSTQPKQQYANYLNKDNTSALYSKQPKFSGHQKKFFSTLIQPHTALQSHMSKTTAKPFQFISNKQTRKVLILQQPNHEEQSLFQNQLLREKLKLAKNPQMCKVKEIVFTEKMERLALNNVNRKSFKIRSRKFRLMNGDSPGKSFNDDGIYEDQRYGQVYNPELSVTVPF